MFSKPAKADPFKSHPSRAEAGRRKSPMVASLIAADLVIDGDVTSQGDLHLDGAIRGDVRVPRLSIGESGRVEGAIHAEWVEVRGHVTGSITANQVKLTSVSHVDGDITHEQLTVETGAFFQGRSQKLQPAPALSAPAGEAAAPVSLNSLASA